MWKRRNRAEPPDRRTDDLAHLDWDCTEVEHELRGELVVRADAAVAAVHGQHVRAVYDAERGCLGLWVGDRRYDFAVSDQETAHHIESMCHLEPTVVRCCARGTGVLLSAWSPSWSYSITGVPAAS